MSGLSVLGAPLLGVAIKGSALLVLAWLCAGALRRRSAATRHAVWCIALLGLLSLPTSSALLPAWRAPLASEALGTVVERGAEPTAGRLAPDAAVPVAGTDRTAPAQGTDPSAAQASPDRAATSALSGWPGGGTTLRPAPVDAPGPAAAEERPAWGLSMVETGVLAWAAGTLLIVLLLVAERVRVERLGRRARPVPPRGRLSAAARHVAERTGLERLPRLLIGDEGAMPMTWGVWRPALLLPPDAARWTARRLDAVLLHELAHVRRRDYLTQLLGAVACAFHWFNPLAWMALANLRRERELACDDEVLAAGSLPSGYASELLDLVRARRTAPAPPLGALAMARPSQLPERLRALLDESRVRSRLTRRLLATAAGLGLVVLVPLAALAPASPAEAAAASDRRGNLSSELGRTASQPPVETAPNPRIGGEPSPVEPDGAPLSAASQEAPPWLPSTLTPCANAATTSRRAVEHEGSWTVTLEAEDCRFEFRLVRGLGIPEGDEPLEFDAEFRRIVRMEQGSSLEIRSREDVDGERRIVVRPREDGRPEIRYWRSGEPVAFDADAAEWLAAALVPVLRMTGLQAEARTRYVHRLGGVDGVLWEVDRIGTDRVQSLYLLALVDEAELAGNELDRVLETAAEAIGSDATMRRLLVELVERRPALIEEDGWAAFRRAAATVGSDAEHRRLLIALLDRPGTDARVAGRLVAAADGEIGSDAEMRRFLISVVGRRPGALVEDGIWSTAATIGSDAEMRRFLSAVAGSRPDALAGEGFWTAVASIGSDAEMARALLDVTAAWDDPRTLGSALDAARHGLGSDADMTRFLLAFADRHREATTGPLQDRYREAAATIGSGRERERALAPLSR